MAEQMYETMNPQLHSNMAHTETTRYLCAAAHVDPKFRDYVMKHIVEEEHRAIGELYGVDIIPIVQWGFAARQRTLSRDMVLFILLPIAIFIGIQHFGTHTSYGYDSYGYYSYPYDVGPPFWIYLLFIPVGLILMSLLSYIPSPILTILYLALAVALASTFPLFGLFFLFVWVIAIIEAGICYYGSRARLLTKNRFRSDAVQFQLDSTLVQKLRAISTVQDGNVVVYSGYSPFVGAGFNIGGWSFLVDVSKGKREAGTTLTPKAFRVTDLYANVADAIAHLRVNDLVIEDKLFVNGQEIRDDRRFLAHPLARPSMQANGPTMIQQFRENSSQDIRYYKCIRVTSWKGELVLSIFVRFVRIKEKLFIEADYLLLPPLKEEYYRIDTIEPTLTVRKFGRLVAETFFLAVGPWFRSPVSIFSSAFHNWFLRQVHRRTERQIRENPAFDYGAGSSLREVASSTKYRRHFQLLDKEMYVKIIEGQLLDTIISFLDARNIDTSDLKDRQETILNNGVIVSGGSFQAQNLAIGEQARAIFSSVTESLRGRGESPAGSTKQAARA